MKIAKPIKVTGRSMASNAASIIFALLIAPIGLAQDVQQDAKKIRIWMGHPGVTRGPESGFLDNPFNVMRLPDGEYRQFTANQVSYRLEGVDPWSNGGVATPVIGPIAGTYASCGFWINDAFPGNDGYQYAFAHAESNCNYAAGQTHKSMALLRSDDYGVSWQPLGQIITGNQAPVLNEVTGEGDCTSILVNSFRYIYCLRNNDNALIAARAPVNAFGPGGWMKYLNGSWSSPGIGGDATPVSLAIGSSMGSAPGGTISYWRNSKYALLLTDHSFSSGLHGLTPAISSDMVNFYGIDEPLIVQDSISWNRPNQNDLSIYFSVIGDDDGGQRSFPGKFELTYTYLPPDGGFDKRYLVFQDVYIWLDDSLRDGYDPHVTAELSRYKSAAGYTPQITTTTAPVPGLRTGEMMYEGSIGNVMTQPPYEQGAPATTELEECVSNWSTIDDLVNISGGCVSEGFRRLRTLGWIYTNKQPGTLPLYRCWGASLNGHFASTSPNCEGMGVAEWQLGWILAP